MPPGASFMGPKRGATGSDRSELRSVARLGLAAPPLEPGAEGDDRVHRDRQGQQRAHGTRRAQGEHAEGRARDGHEHGHQERVGSGCRRGRRKGGRVPRFGTTNAATSTASAVAVAASAATLRVAGSRRRATP